jgi:hypothetical protein
MTSADNDSKEESKIDNATHDKDSPIGNVANANFNHKNCIYDLLNEQIQNNNNNNIDSTSSSVRARERNQETPVKTKPSKRKSTNENRASTVRVKRAINNESSNQDSDGDMEVGTEEFRYDTKSLSKQHSAVRAREDISSSSDSNTDMISYTKRTKYSHTKESITSVEPSTQPVVTKQDSEMDIIVSPRHGLTTKRRSESQATPTHVKYLTPEGSSPDTPGGRSGIG